VFILLGKESRKLVPLNFSPGFFCQSLNLFLVNQWAIDGKEKWEKGGAPGKENNGNYSCLEENKR